MKQVIFSMICTILIIEIAAPLATAQSVCDPNKIIRTDPANPINTEKLNKTNGSSFGNSAQPHNGAIFNWLADTENNPGFNVNSSVMTSTQSVNSPFWQYNNPKTQIFINQWAQNNRIDNLPADGWELIHQDFGYSDNGTPRGAPNPGEKVDYPHLILYNRYQGVLRVFVNIGYLNGNTADISLTFESLGLSEPMQTSLLDMAHSTTLKPLNALDDFRGSLTKKGNLNGLADYLGYGPHWYFADFAMLYDPCTCYLQSKIHVYVDIIKVATISLEGSTNGELIDKASKDDANTINTLNGDGESKLSIGGLTEVAQKAAQSYSTVADFTNSTKNRIDSYYFVGPNISVKMREEIEKNREIAKSSLNSLDKIINSTGSFGKDMLKYAPYLSAAWTLVDFFVAGGKAPEQPQKVSISPICVNLTTNLSGEIRETEPQKNILIYTPGSNIPNLNTVGYEYPYYNQTLGVMNLWRTPKLEYKSVLDNIVNYEYLGETYWPEGTFHIFNTKCVVRNKYYFKMPDDIEYVVNPAARFKTGASEIDVTASVIMEFSQAAADRIKFTNESYWNWVNDTTVISTAIPIGCLKNLDLSFSEEQIATNGTLYIDNINTPQTVVTCDDLTQLVSTLWNNQYSQESYTINSPITMPRLYVKVLANLEREDKTPTTQNVFWCGKFKYNTVFKNEGVNYFAVSNPLQTYPKDIELNTTNEPNPISSDRIAMRTIVIKQGVTFATGQNILIKAGLAIEVEPGVEIPSNVTLQIGLPFTCSTPLGPKTITSNDCNQNYYRANRGLSGKMVEEDVEGKKFDDYNAWIEVVPNPVENIFQVKYYSRESSSPTIEVFNSIGQKLMDIPITTSIANQINSVTVESQLLPPGVYKILMHTNNKVASCSMVVVR